MLKMKDRKAAEAMERIDSLIIDLEEEGYEPNQIVTALLGCAGIKAEFQYGAEVVERLHAWARAWGDVRGKA